MYLARPVITVTVGLIAGKVSHHSTFQHYEGKLKAMKLPGQRHLDSPGPIIQVCEVISNGSLPLSQENVRNLCINPYCPEHSDYLSPPTNLKECPPF